MLMNMHNTDSDAVQRRRARRRRTALETVPAVGRVSADADRRVSQVAEQVPGRLRLADLPDPGVGRRGRRDRPGTLQGVVIGTQDRGDGADGRRATVDQLRG